MADRRQPLREARRWVVKIGSSLITNEGLGLKAETLKRWVAQIMTLRGNGREVVLVSSGSIAEGLSRLGWKRRPHALHELQAAAAVGQMGLVQAWEDAFRAHGVRTAQILLTHDDIADRRRYLNARSTLRTLVDLDILPIVNENDTVATEEIRFGDNDALAGLVANLIEAQALVILTDQDGLFDADPRKDFGATFIPFGTAGDRRLEKFAGAGGALGRGGMMTKLRAAETAAKSGAHTVIAPGMDDGVLEKIAAGEDVGTFLAAEREPVAARKQWLAGSARATGKLVLDAGAVNALRAQGKSLLAVGVRSVEGEFRRGEIVCCVDEAGTEVARGLVNYNADESRRILGQPSAKIEELLGYVDEPELIHRDNLVLM